MPLPKFVRSNRIWVTGMGKKPHTVKPTRTAVRARRKMIASSAGTRALVTFRPISLQTSQEMISNKATQIFGQGVQVISAENIKAWGKEVNQTAFKKTPADAFELKQKLLTTANHFAQQREAKRGIEKTTNEIDALGKLKLHFALVATVSDIRKLARMNKPKVNVDLIKRLAHENPSIRPLIKIFGTELLTAETEMGQIELFRKAPKMGKVIRIGKGVVEVEVGGVRKIVYSDFRDVKAEARRRAYAVSEVLNKLKQERDNQKRVLAEKSKANLEILANSRPLIEAYKKGKGEKNKLKGVYDAFAKEEEAKELAAKKLVMAARVKDLKSAKTSIEFMKDHYTRMSQVNSFEEGIFELNRIDAVLKSVIREYSKAIINNPELKRIREMEAVQLVYPENKEDVLKTIIAHNKTKIPPKKIIGQVFLYSERGEAFMMPTTVQLIKVLVRIKLDAINETLPILDKMIAEAQK
jgi:hypothetical protein